MQPARHHHPPAPVAGTLIDPASLGRGTPPVLLTPGPDGRLWLERAAAPAFLDWAWPRLDPRGAPDLSVAVARVVVDRLREAPEVKTRFDDARTVAADWVERVAPGRDRFHALWQAQPDDRTPTARALRLAALVAGVTRQRTLAQVSRVQLVLAGLCLDLGAWLLPDDADDRLRAHHPLLSADLLGAHGVGDGLLRDGVRGHHERMDGRGHPVGVGAPALPLGARITGLCDRAVEVLTPPPVGPVLPRFIAWERLAADDGACDRTLLTDLVRLFARRDDRW